MEIRVMDRFRRALTARRDNLLAWLGSDTRDKPTVLSELDHALAAIDEGHFGHCTECNGEVETERLELDFTTCVCLDHYSEAQIRELERDLELAARVQQHLFPCCVPALPGLQIAAHVRPARIVGGDYYDFFCYRDDVQGAVLADVMGKGLPASMLMANLQASLRILGPQHDEPHALAARLNELFRYNLKLIRFISLFLLALDVETRTLRYCNAGHHPPLLWRAASGSVSWLKPTGPALGLLHDPSFQSDAVPFSTGDVLILYTDGLVEARKAGGEDFGEERLARYAGQHHRESADDLLKGLLEAAARFADGIRDDVALLVIKAT